MKIGGKESRWRARGRMERGASREVSESSGWIFKITVDQEIRMSGRGDWA